MLQKEDKISREWKHYKRILKDELDMEMKRMDENYTPWESEKEMETWKCMDAWDCLQWIETVQIKWGAEIDAARFIAWGQILEGFEPEPGDCVCFANP